MAVFKRIRDIAAASVNDMLDKLVADESARTER